MKNGGVQLMTIAILSALILYGVLVAYYSRKGAMKTQGSSTEYFVAGRTVGAIALLGTICLSIWSALAFYGYGAGLYRGGIGYFSGVAGACIVGFYAPTIMYRLWLLGKEYGYITPGDFFFHRYPSNFFRFLVSLVCIIFIIPYVALQIIGVSNGIVVTSDGRLGFWLIVGILTVYILGHVLEGGSNSIVFTDTLAGFAGVGIAFITVVTLIITVLGEGGLPYAGKVILESSPQTLEHTGTYASWIGTLGLSISAGMAIIAWPHIFVRSYMAKSDRIFKVMAGAFPILEVFGFGLFAIQGIWLGKVAFPGLEGMAADNLIPMMALKYTPPIIAVLLVVGVFAFGMSTADSQLLVASSILQKDFFENKNKKSGDKEKIKFGKIMLLVMMAIVLIVVKYRPAVLVDYAYKFSSPGFAQLMPALIGGLYWKKSTKEGAIIGTLGGLVAVIVTLFFKNPIPLVHPILWGLLVNTILFIIVSLTSKNVDSKPVEEIHDYLEGIFRDRNTTASKWLLFFIALVVIQGNILPPYLPNPILFGWLPFQFLNYILYAIELSILCYHYAKIQIGETKTSKAA